MFHRVVSAAEEKERVAKNVVGFAFDGRVFKMALPRVKEDDYFIPDPYTMAILGRPKHVPQLNPSSHFKILTYIPPPMSESSAESLPPAKGKAKNGKKPPAPAPKKKEAAPAVPIGDAEYLEDTRWVIPAKGTVQLAVRFSSEELGRFHETLNFDVLSGEQKKLPVSGICDYPRIATDHRNLYYKTSKARPATPLVSKQFITSKSLFEFGPLLAGAEQKDALAGKKPEHGARFRITNNGHFPLEAEFFLKSTLPPPEPDADPSVRRVPVPNKGKATFLLHPTTIELKVDETQDLQLWAFPPEEGDHEDVVVCRIKDNPSDFEFPICVQVLQLYEIFESNRIVAV